MADKKKKNPTAQQELPGTKGPQTKTELRALEVAQARYDVNRMAERARHAEDALIKQMVSDKQFKVVVRDTASQIHTFELQELRKIKHRTRGGE